MKELEKAIELRKEGKLKESNQLLVHLVNKYPNDPIINFQCAWSFDALGLERNAVQYYKKAISIGLPDEELRNAYLGLGSTYRTLGQYKESKEVLEEGLSKFLQDKAMEVFYAMTLYNLKEHSKAMEILLNIIVETSLDQGIKKYKKAIEFYSDKLDEVW
ncbi:MAG: tetratricopeptide repeat protein [Tissierellia bacterium]|nr:tetratricopeptide repeat protein [Tissierellia bacterium]